ncbi:tripartite tricarboxylate transporter substrate binding protein [Paracoccus gahaiensis]|uniref:Tripartite tricarboxylate transporter substrate binding protein n=1 Tax=Paracoccus gahaiensis TaxID=1706839 RepID=A0A4U0R6T1_9RHOB|nr:tripartite tricarboxylate transporter substrate binding protein [Paracoccus gahaiensis]TJZ90617.1 tripartite tricarboxylate transporter substrate binding protein [Paracoccus gahaiensis]
MNSATLMALAASCAVMATPLAALADYPEQDIRVVVPWGAGGGTDAIVRKLTLLAEAEMGGTMYVENIDGGISATGVNQVMRAEPDGHTIVALTYDSVVTIPWQEMLPGYDMDKLKLIARVTSEPDSVVINSGSKYQTLDALIAAAKDSPDTIRIAIQNIGGRVHLALLQLEQLSGTKFKTVSYPGGAGPQKEAILSGEAEGAVTSLGDFANLLEDDTVIGLAEFSSTANPTYPDVPLATDLGVDLQIGSFIVMAAPAGTPDDVVAKIEAAYQAAYDSAEFQEWVANVGVTPDWLGSADVTAWAEETQTELFGQMDALVEAGVLSK